MSFIINPFRFSITACTGSVINTTNLTAYYKFNSNTDDTSSSAQNGTLFGGPTYVSGKFNNALHTTGTTQQGMSATTNTAFEGSGGTISVFCWVKVTDYIEGAPHAVNKWNGSSSGWRIVPRAADILVTLGNTNITKGTGVASGSTWVQIGFTYDNTNCVIYQNGVSAGTIQNVGAKTLSSTNNFFVARASNTNAGYFKGDIDDVSVWKRVLGKQEILDLYNATCPLSGA